ncbi:conserved hypothetical protein [Xanthomonas citri pv. aurantifolii str. ICPB 10535]|nr:conserved hypothetical protein [Xanthomonas citri pv. aurantifolii str. ICPB 10535]
MVQQVLDDTPITIDGTARSIRQGAGTALHASYRPLSQRGFVTAELLASDLSAGQALRTAGILATAADTVMTGQRATQFLGQDNPLAAQSELAHFAGRNVGGWAGGTAAAYALGSSGAGPMVLIAADAYFLSTAGEKAAALLDNRAIYTQTDHAGTQWSFNGTAWAREGKADTTNDGVDNPTSTPIVASYEKARELNYQATNAAAALALKDAPAPQDPYRQPANATDRPSLSSADWRRDAANGQWHRLVKAEISGANDRGSYVQETASPERAAELDAQAQETIARNIANSPGAIAARYELAHHRSGWAADGLPMSPAVQQALPDPDALTASDGQRYYRNIEGQWTATVHHPMATGCWNLRPRARCCNRHWPSRRGRLPPSGSLRRTYKASRRSTAIALSAPSCSRNGVKQSNWRRNARARQRDLRAMARCSCSVALVDTSAPIVRLCICNAAPMA